MTAITFIGSSIKWIPTLLTDLMSVFEEPLDVRMLDLSEEPARLCCEWGEAASARLGRQDRFTPFTNRTEALQGADAVLITLSTGGLAAMEQDIAIPERYGVYATVGDTAGPGGWSRSIRNIPVFREFSEDFARICPAAFIANYSNPLSALTAVLDRCAPNPVVGLCHAYFETKDVIQAIFQLPTWDPISVAIAGMNHFTWVVDFKIGREDGYRLLRERIGNGSLRDVLPAKSTDEIGFASGHELCIRLYDTYGYLPYPADRHTSEFVSFVLGGEPERYTVRDREGTEYDTTRYCDVRRTAIQHRRDQFQKRWEEFPQWVHGLKEGTVDAPKRSRETGAEMIHAYLHNRPFCDAVNVLNRGQIASLPAGACVETLGVVDGLGVRPLMVDEVPEPLSEIMRPQAVNQKWIVEGMMEGKRNLVMQGLYNDPLCRCMKPEDAAAMGNELIEANRPFLQGVLS
jgi:alpha-galactosidase/6-phospho-beta-glucosidase family protein